MKLAKKDLTTASLNSNDPHFDFQFRVDPTGLGSPEHGLMAVLTSDTQGFAEEYATVPGPWTMLCFGSGLAGAIVLCRKRLLKNSEESVCSRKEHYHENIT